MTPPPFYKDKPEPENHTDELEFPSRSQLKRDAEEITQLGQTISELSASDLAKIPLEERAADAVHQLRKIRSFGARKRQLHYLGKILRNSELRPIRDALETIQLESQLQNKQFHDAEHWRDLLLNEGQPALQDFLSKYPLADRQRLRQLLRNHHKETNSAANGKTPSSKAAREIFKLIRNAISQQ